MFTRARIYDGGSYLENHLTANDYYAEGEKVSGHWIGRGSDLLGLCGEVESDQFESLRKNQLPGKMERLTPRTKGSRQPTVREAEEAFRLNHCRVGSPIEVANFRLEMKPLPNRVAFYDYQCSAQKSVSLMAVLAGDDRLLEAHERSARKGFAELEQFASRQKNTRTQRDWEMTGNLCAAAFTHDASRALDPQLHTHFVIANATHSASGRWYALEECHMYKAARYAGKVYQNELAREVKALGYSIHEVRDPKGQITGFEIDGVPEELCRRFAKRRAEIEREIAKFEKKHGREPTSAEIARISRETRSAKLAEKTTPEVRANQRAQLRPGEWKQLQAVKLAALERVRHGVRAHTAEYERQSLRPAVEHLYERQSVLPVYAILAEGLNQGLGAVDLIALQQSITNGDCELVRLTDRNDQPLLSECCTRQGLELEQWSVNFVNSTRNRCAPLNPCFAPMDNLSAEQQAAVQAILATKDQVFSFRGVAGAGKTTALKAVHRGLSDAGHRAIYIAPTTAAVEVLRSEGFGAATTLEDFLHNVSRRENLNGAVIICDESGLQSNRQGTALLQLAEKHRMRILLVGDVRQHVSVEAGDFLRVLETHSQLRQCEVTEIRRQQAAPAYKAAIEQMAEGRARAGMAALDALGWLHEGGNEYLNRAAEDYVRLAQTGTDSDSILLVAPTWAENHVLTEAIRPRLKAIGKLGDDSREFIVHDSLQWTIQQKRCVGNYQTGQRIVFTRPVAGWTAGESATVSNVTHDGKVIVGKDDQVRELPLQKADAFDVGQPRAVSVAKGDKVLIRANEKRSGLINGQVLTAHSIDAEGTIVTREGIRIPSTFRQWCHGYVVTSHKSQGRTCEHVIVAAERLDAKSAYVACSRGKLSCSVHTPEKRHLIECLPEGNRRSALDVLGDNFGNSDIERENADSLSARARAWLRLSQKTIGRNVEAAKRNTRHRIEQVRQMYRRWRQYRTFILQQQFVSVPEQRSDDIRVRVSSATQRSGGHHQ